VRFEYRGRNSKGGLEQGVLEAGTRDGVAAELQRRGITPVSVEPEPDQSTLQERFENISLFKPKATLDDLIVFCRQMYALAKAGIPIIRTMRGLAETSKSKALSEALDDIADRLEAGTTMATAMQANPEVFSDLFSWPWCMWARTPAGLMMPSAVSRKSWSLSARPSDASSRRHATRFFVIVALTAALIIVNFFVIPQFTATFERLGADLPFLTQLLIMTSDFMTTYWPALLGVLPGLSTCSGAG